MLYRVLSVLAEPCSGLRMPRQKVAALASDVQDADQVFATCSSFSLIAGPLVGSRANALTKRAMYSGVEAWDDSDNKRFNLLFHIGKYVPFASLPPGEIQIDEPKPTCSAVFTRPSQLAKKAIDDWQNDLSEDDERSVRYRMSWHSKLFSSEDVVRQPVAKFERMTRPKVLIPNELSTTWLDWCNRCRHRQVSFLLGLPDVQLKTQWSLDFLNSELKEVNELLRKGGFCFHYALVNAETAQDDRVAEFTIKDTEDRQK